MSEAPRRIEYVPIDEVVRAVRNPRTHDTLEGVKASIRRFGFVDGAVHDGRTGRIIAGHGRLEALTAMWGDHEEPPEGIVVQDGRWLMPLQMGWSSANDEAADALLVWLNKSVEDGGWDERGLADLLMDLRSGEDPSLLALSGFDNAALDKLLKDLSKNEPLKQVSDPDEVPNLMATPRSQAGDLWLLGEHRLLVGDACERSAIDRLMDGERADLVFTDPPYGVAYYHGMTPEDAKRLNHRTDGATVPNDTLEGSELKALLGAALGNALEVCKPGGVWYVCAPAGDSFLAFAELGVEMAWWRHTLVWVKHRFVFGQVDYHYRHEQLMYGWKPGAAHHSPPDRDQDSVWEFDMPHRSAEHPTMKPVGLVTRAIRNSSLQGQVVLDPFAGSGTTIIAAEMTHRKARAVEIDRRYADVICRRYQAVTGTMPVLEATNEVHDFTLIDQGDVPPAGMAGG